MSKKDGNGSTDITHHNSDKDKDSEYYKIIRTYAATLIGKVKTPKALNNELIKLYRAFIREHIAEVTVDPKKSNDLLYMILDIHHACIQNHLERVFTMRYQKLLNTMEQKKENENEITKNGDTTNGESENKTG